MRPSGPELSEPFADTTYERNELLPLVGVKCLLLGGNRLLLAAGGLEHLGQVAEQVPLPHQRVGLEGELHGFAHERLYQDRTCRLVERCRGRDLNPHGPRATRF